MKRRIDEFIFILVFLFCFVLFDVFGIVGPVSGSYGDDDYIRH